MKFIFELKVICHADEDSPYPEFKVRLDRRYFLSTFRASLKLIGRLAKEASPTLYRFILLKLPLDKAILGNDFLRLWIFGNSGNLIDRSLCSGMGDDYDRPAGKFWGRPAQLQRFRKGDIVEWYDGHETVKLGIISGIAPTPEECCKLWAKIQSRRKNRQLPITEDDYPLDISDDCCAILDNPYDISSHYHVFTPFISFPTFPLSEEMRKRLNEYPRGDCKN